jgi:hypothetical protein
MKNNIHFILDETGSMQIGKQATMDAFNEYVNGLKKDKKNKYRMSLTKFDSNGVNIIYKNFKLKNVPELNDDNYSPAAMTNLNDAIGKTITEVDNDSKKNLVVILTDGQENSSKEWTVVAVKDLLERKEKEGWTVTFLGMDLDAQQISFDYGIHLGNTKSFKRDDVQATMDAYTQSTAQFVARSSARGATREFFSGSTD